MNETNLIEDLRLLAPPPYGWGLALVATVALVAALVFLLWRRRRCGPVPVVGSDSAASPWDLALAELERLAPLMRTDRSRDYAIAATGVLRSYIEARFGLHAPRLTTEEFLVAARRSPTLPAADQAALGCFLERCDLCKFGRFVAAVDELRDLQASAVAFVLKSRPEGQPASGGAQPGVNA